MSQRTVQYSFDKACKNTNVLFLHGSNKDTVYFSKQISGSFLLDTSLKKQDILMLIINGQIRDYKYIALDADTLSFTIEKSEYKNYYNLNFTGNTPNREYHTEVKNLLPLKSISDSLIKLSYDTSLTQKDLKAIGRVTGQIRDSINKTWANFFIKNCDSYFALNFISANLLNSNTDKSVLLNIFNCLDGSFNNTNLYEVVKRKILDTSAQIIVGSKVPDFQFKDKLGNAVSILPLIKKNQKNYVLFWASWCYGCHIQFPYIKTHYSELKDRNTGLFFVSMDADNRNALRDMTEYGFLSNSYFLESGFDDINIYRLRLDYIPYMFCVNSEGIITELAVKVEDVFK